MAIKRVAVTGWANSRNAAIPLDSARSRQSESCFNNWSVDVLDRLHSAVNSCRIE